MGVTSMGTTWYFSFGIGSPLAKYYVPIVAEEEWQARAAMWCLFSQHWGSCYKSPPDNTHLLRVNYNACIRVRTAGEEGPHDLFDLGHRVLCEQPPAEEFLERHTAIGMMRGNQL